MESKFASDCAASSSRGGADQDWTQNTSLSAPLNALLEILRSESIFCVVAAILLTFGQRQ
jgi:hypothetical protein